MQMSSSLGLMTLLTVRFYSHLQHVRSAWGGVRRPEWIREGEPGGKGRSSARLFARCLQCVILHNLPRYLREWGTTLPVCREGNTGLGRFMWFPQGHIVKKRQNWGLNPCLSELRAQILLLKPCWLSFICPTKADVLSGNWLLSEAPTYGPKNCPTAIITMTTKYIQGHHDLSCFSFDKRLPKPLSFWILPTLCKDSRAVISIFILQRRKLLAYQENDFCSWCAFQN